jgi:putative FmdB family regulatory protein
MPIYDYICDDCGYKFEEFSRSMNHVQLECCPQCSSPHLRIKLSAPTVIYKGAGFATTEARGITGHKRKPKIKVGFKKDLDG